MPRSSQKKILNYNAKDLFNIVLDIESYPDFLPWCSASRIINYSNNQIIADLLICYKNFNETFRSFVDFNKKDLVISVKYTEGPLKSLYTNWQFDRISNNETLIIFDLDIKFKFFPLNQLLNGFYKSIEDKMMNAFEKRASKILEKDL